MHCDKTSILLPEFLQMFDSTSKQEPHSSIVIIWIVFWAFSLPG